MKYIGVVGARSRKSQDDFYSVLNAILNNFEHGDVLVSGGCKVGVDNFCRENFCFHN